VTYDNAAPVITNTTSTPITCTGSPMNVTITATTNEAATCRYSVSDLGYPSMTTAMSTTGGTSHSQSINLSCGTSYTYYVSCIDALGNANTAANNAAIAFTIGSTRYHGSGDHKCFTKRQDNLYEQPPRCDDNGHNDETLPVNGISRTRPMRSWQIPLRQRGRHHIQR
jgi:hypothetical protein